MDLAKISSGIIASDSGLGTIIFNTLSGFKIPLIYKKKLHTLNQIIKKFEENYHSFTSSNKKTSIQIDYYLSDIQSCFNETLTNKTPDEIGMPLKATIDCRANDNDNETINFDEASKRFTELEELKKNNSKDIYQIFIKNLTNNTTKLEVLPFFTITDIKIMIYMLDCIPVEQQRIIYAGIQLFDEDTLINSGITKESTLYCILRLRGGMYHETSGRDGGFGELKDTVIFMD